LRTAIRTALARRKRNGGWAPHVHFQIISRSVGTWGRLSGGRVTLRSVRFGRASRRIQNHLLGIPASDFQRSSRVFPDTLAARQALLGKNLSISYQHPTEDCARLDAVSLRRTRAAHISTCTTTCRSSGTAIPVSSKPRRTACAAQYQHALSTR